MIKIDRHIMSNKGFVAIKKSLIKDLKKKLNFKFDISFKEIICEEGDSEVIISTTGDNYDALTEFVYCDGENELITKYSGDYGSFIFRIEKILKEDVTDVGIGDFVALDSSIGSEQYLGIVTSISEKEGKKYFGCSYLNVCFIGSIYSKNNSFSSEINLSEEDYGGYKEGFAKKLTAEEAKKILLEQIEKEYNDEVYRLQQDREHLKISANKIIKIINNKKSFDVFQNKSIKFKNNIYWGFEIPKNLKEQI